MLLYSFESLRKVIIHVNDDVVDVVVVVVVVVVSDLQVETQQRVKYGDSVSLRCKSSCSLPQQTTFIWYRNSQRITRGIVKGNQLHLWSVSYNDEGNYRCAVRGHEHLISPDVYLHVDSE